MVELRLPREEVLRTLQVAQSGVTRQEVIEQSDCFVFQDGWVMTYNDELSCRVPSPFGEAVTGVVKGKALVDFVAGVPDDEVCFRAKEGVLLGWAGGGVGVKARRHVRFTLTSEVFLPFKDVEPPGKWRRLPESFEDAAYRVGSCAGRDGNRFNTTCVHFTPEYMQCLDGNQMCRWRLKTGVEESLLARWVAVKNVIGLGVTKVSTSPTWLHFKNSAGMVLSCRRYPDDDFPDLEEGMNVTGSVLELPAGLAEASLRAAPFCEGADGQEAMIRVDLRPGLFVVIGIGAQAEYTERKKVKYDGPKLSFYTTPQTIAEVVKGHRTCRVSPDHLRADGEHYTYVTCLVRPDEVVSMQKEAATAEGES